MRVYDILYNPGSAVVLTICTKNKWIALQGRTHYTTDKFKCFVHVCYLGQTKDRQGRKIDLFVM